MRIIISPAKIMRTSDVLAPIGTPVFLEKTKEVLNYLQGLSYLELKKLWQCNEKLANENSKRLSDMDLSKNLSPAILAYDGIAYKYMAPIVFENDHFNYVQEHLRILSAFYGVLKPMDGIVSYRLEMMAKAKVNQTKNLYAFWDDLLYQEVIDDSHIIINLASKEYSRCIEDHVTTEDSVISYTFGELSGGDIIQKTVHVKMARGEMVRFMAENNAKTPEDTRAFCGLGFSFDKKRSTDNHYVFLK